MTTLNDYYEKYYEIRKNSWRATTRTDNKYIYDRFCKDAIGSREITEIRYSDMRAFYTRLIDTGTLQISSLENVHGVLHPVFQMAVMDDVISRNPTDGLIREIKRAYHWKRPKRHALTEPQQNAFIDYVSNSGTTHIKRLLPLFVTFLGTGGRISEITGLTWEDVHFDENYIEINHTLAYRKLDDGQFEFHIIEPKTSAGNRKIPMLTVVREMLELERDRQQLSDEYDSDFTVDGHKGFVFRNRNGRPHIPQVVNRSLKRIIAQYNAEEQQKASIEGREPLLLPDFSVHSLRHTFATRLCENETNLKVIQEIMGHSDITITMNIYNEAVYEKKEESMAKLEGIIRIGKTAGEE